MNAADIRAWLASGQDYAQGAALYAQLGTRPVYQRLFALPPTDYSRGILQRELQGLLPAEPEPTSVATLLPTELPAAAPEPVPAGPGSPLLLDVRRQLKASRDERSYLHPQLTAPGLRRTKRYELAGRIIDLTDQEQELLAAEAHVQQHGRLPGPVLLRDVTDPLELQRRLLNLRAQRSKLKKQPARAAELAQAEADITWILTSLKS